MPFPRRFIGLLAALIRDFAGPSPKLRLAAPVRSNLRIRGNERMFYKSIAALLLPIAMLSAAARFDEKVRNDFFAGIAGDHAALQRAMAASEDAIANDPQAAAEAKSWHGVGNLILAGQKFQQGDTAAGSQLWARANKEMDEAGRMEPDNPGVLIPRASAWLAASRSAPPEMGAPLLTKGLADYEHVYDLQQAYFDRLGIHPRSELLFGLADGFARAGNKEKATLYFTKLAALGPQSGHQQQADLYLKGENYSVTGIGCAGCHTGK
jgi:tetratricopeptide (TPR) repeat protein